MKLSQRKITIKKTRNPLKTVTLNRDDTQKNTEQIYCDYSYGKEYHLLRMILQKLWFIKIAFSLENNQTQVYEHVSLRMNTATQPQIHRTTDSESIQLTMSLPVLKVVGSVCKSCTTKSN